MNRNGKGWKRHRPNASHKISQTGKRTKKEISCEGGTKMKWARVFSWKKKTSYSQTKWSCNERGEVCNAVKNSQIAQDAKGKRTDHQTHVAKSLLRITHTKSTISLRANLPSLQLLHTINKPINPLPLLSQNTPTRTRPRTRRNPPPFHEFPPNNNNTSTSPRSKQERISHNPPKENPNYLHKSSQTECLNSGRKSIGERNWIAWMSKQMAVELENPETLADKNSPGSKNGKMKECVSGEAAEWGRRSWELECVSGVQVKSDGIEHQTSLNLWRWAMKKKGENETRRTGFKILKSQFI